MTRWPDHGRLIPVVQSLQKCYANVYSLLLAESRFLPFLNGYLMNKPLNILIVDDNLNFVNRLIGLIKELNQVEYIHIAENYDEACEYLAEDIPDVALLDINLPGKNGLAVLKKVKEAAPDCNVIMITNHADDYYRQLCQEMGAGHFLDKTIEFSRVPHIIRELSLNMAIN